MTRTFRAPVFLTLALALPLSTFAATSAAATEQPYTVTTDGITLTQPLADNFHINVKSDAGDKGIHGESKCVTRTDAECAGTRHDVAQYIGKSFVPWSAVGLTDCFTITWVQVSGENFHWGAQGEDALKVGCAVDPPISPPLVEVCWELPNGGTATNVTWPQTLVADCRPPKCEVTQQIDTYTVDEAAKFTADGVLELGEDYGSDTQTGAISWRFVAGGDCPVVEPPTDEPPVDVCPNIDGDQTELPADYVLDAGECVLIIEPPVCTERCTPDDECELPSGDCNPPLTCVDDCVEQPTRLAITGVDPLTALGIVAVLGLVGTTFLVFGKPRRKAIK